MTNAQNISKIIMEKFMVTHTHDTNKRQSRFLFTQQCTFFSSDFVLVSYVNECIMRYTHCSAHPATNIYFSLQSQGFSRWSIFKMDEIHNDLFITYAKQDLH